MDLLSFPVVVRNFKLGDRFRPLGMSGSQKLKKFFINNKIARAERTMCPLLVSNGSIIWIAGHRMSDTVKVKPSTRKILKGELFLA